MQYKKFKIIDKKILTKNKKKRKKCVLNRHLEKEGSPNSSGDDLSDS